MISKNLPKVSIVLPTCNGTKYIRQSINSCLKQTYNNIELVIVDDGSTDNTPQIVKSYKDKRIKYLRHKKNRGLSYSLNTGFANTKGEYLTWTSDDNYYDEKAIKKMLSFLEKKKCDFVYCDFYRFNEEKPNSYNRLNLPNIPVLKNHNDIGPCFLYSKKVKEIVGDYDTNVTLAEDYDYWIRVSKRFSLCHLAEPLYFYREHSQSLTSLRYNEIKVSGVLIRIKNKVLEIGPATDNLIGLIAEKYPNTLRINNILAKIIFYRKIKKVLNAFIRGEKSFEEAKTKLKKILK